MSFTELLNQNRPLFIVGGVICAALLFILGAVVFYKFQKIFKFRQRRKRLEKGERAEETGLKLLRQEGFRVIAAQQNLECVLHIDGEVKTYTLRPDAYVVKNGKTYLAEIKSGSVAPDPLFKDTRRQLLEYYYCGNCDGVLLVNTEKRQIQEIEFKKKSVFLTKKRSLRSFFLGIIIGVIITLFSLIIYFVINKNYYLIK